MTQTPDAGALLPLIAWEQQCGNDYRCLAGQASPSRRAVLTRMAREAGEMAGCLSGIYRMMTGTRAAVSTQPPGAGQTETMLRRCYGKSVQLLENYQARIDWREYGAVFSDLAKVQQAHCRMLLQLLG